MSTTEHSGELGEGIECAYHGQPMTLDKTVGTWGLGICCLGCGMPVSITITHPGPTVPLSDSFAPSTKETQP